VYPLGTSRGCGPVEVYAQWISSGYSIRPSNIYEGQLTLWNASDASSSRKGVKGLLSVSNRKLALFSSVSKILNMSPQFTDGKCLRSRISIGGETLSLGSDHRNSEAITSHVVDEMYKLPEALVELILSSQRMSLMPRSWSVLKWRKWSTHLDPIDRKGAGICD
jgi:hypothetical protein